MIAFVRQCHFQNTRKNLLGYIKLEWKSMGAHVLVQKVEGYEGCDRALVFDARFQLLDYLRK